MGDNIVVYIDIWYIESLKVQIGNRVQFTVFSPPVKGFPCAVCQIP